MAGVAVLRWVRALLLASVMLAAGCSGHAVGGGGAAPGALLGPMLVVTTIAVAPFLDAPASTLRVVALVLAAQGVLHVALDVVSGGTRAGTSPAMASHAAGMAAMTADGSMTSAHAVSSAHVGMLLAHVAAAIVVTAWLAAGERAVWTLVGVSLLLVTTTWRAVRASCWLTPVVVAGPRPHAVLVRVDGLLVRQSVWDGHSGTSRRGPPRGCAA